MKLSSTIHIPATIIWDYQSKKFSNYICQVRPYILLLLFPSITVQTSAWGGKRTQCIFAYLHPTYSTPRGSVTHSTVVSFSSLWLQLWSKSLLKSLYEQQIQCIWNISE